MLKTSFLPQKLNFRHFYRECHKNLNICVSRVKFWIKSGSKDSPQLVPIFFKPDFHHRTHFLLSNYFRKKYFEIWRYFERHIGYRQRIKGGQNSPSWWLFVRCQISGGAHWCCLSHKLDVGVAAALEVCLYLRGNWVLPTEHKGNTPTRDVSLLAGGWVAQASRA